MRLTMREAASFLGVSESKTEKWVEERGLPAHRWDERWYVNPVELWEWAVEQGIPVSRALLEDASRKRDEGPRVSELLRAGGIYHDVPGATKEDALRSFVACLPLPPGQDREFLLDVLVAREALSSTGIGDGIAIPHVRNPILLHVERPFVALALLRQPVTFGAIDGLPVHALFMVISPSVSDHLGILARLAFVLHDQELRALLRARAPAERILARVETVESTRNTGEHPVTRSST
ncbi:MAG: PTS sugar transporter subunit IIA [Gemmatimonadales bacterium]